MGEGIVAAGRADAMGHGQQVKVVVAEQAMGRIAIGHETAQHRGRFGAPVDQIAEHIQRVAAGGEVELGQQPGQGGVATLDVADTVKCHLLIVACLVASWMSCCLFS